MQLDDRSGKLRSDGRCGKPKLVESFLLLAGTASHRG